MNRTIELQVKYFDLSTHLNILGQGVLLSKDVTELQIGVKGKLTDGTVFGSSFERGDPIDFELGTCQVIKGLDQGLLGYGAQGSPPTIPGGATLIFDTELVSVNGKPSTGNADDEVEEDEEL